MIYGRDFEDEAIPMEEIMGEMGEVTVRGRILKLDKRETVSYTHLTLPTT